MYYETIETTSEDGIFTITLNRTEARNAMSTQMQADMCNALDTWDKDDSLRVCIITNAGTVFCAGADLKEIAKDCWHLPEGHEHWGFAGMTKRWFDKPIIAAVQGKCLGGGLEMVLACDLCVASEDALFGFPEPRVGLTAAGGGALLRVMQQIPAKFANELVLCADPINAQRALDFGLINAVVPAEEVLPRAKAFAASIAKGAPLSIQYSKRTMYETTAESPIYPSTGWDTLEKYEKITRNSEDAHEGSTAFSEKRTPVWKGR